MLREVSVHLGYLLGLVFISFFMTWLWVCSVINREKEREERLRAGELARWGGGDEGRKLERLEEEYGWYMEMMRERNPAADREARERIAAVRGIDEDGAEGEGAIENGELRMEKAGAAGAARGKSEFATPRLVRSGGGEAALLKYFDYLEAEIRDLTALIEDKDKEIEECLKRNAKIERW